MLKNGKATRHSHFLAKFGNSVGGVYTDKPPHISKSHHKHPPKNQIFPLTLYFIYDKLKVYYVESLRKSKFKQLAGTTDNQNRKSYTFRGNFFCSAANQKKNAYKPLL